MNQSSQTPVRAAIYLRISLDREMDGLAIERQREDCEKLARYRCWEVVETYVDQSKSATSRNVRRPRYEQMVSDYRAGAFEAIICYDLDRLTRQPRQLEDWIDAAETRGLILVTANGDADLSTDGGRMYARIKAAVAKGEVDRKSARQSRAQRQRAEQGRAPKGVRPLGYAINGDTIDREAEAVRAIYTAFLKGASLHAIARGLTGGTGPDVAEGLPVLPRHSYTLALERNARRTEEGLKERPVPPDNGWSASTVLGILRNARYAGYSVYSRKKDRQQPAGESRRRALRDNIVKDEAGEPVLGTWEALVDADRWWTVQSMLDDPKRVTNRTGSNTRKHLGAGLFRCSQCGRRVITRARYYSCPDRHMNRTREPIDDFVHRVVAERLRQPDALARKVTADPSVKDSYAELIARQRERIARAQHDYDAEIIEGADLARVRGSARDEIERLEAERLASGVGTVLAPVLGAENPAEAFLSGNLAVQRSVIDVLMTVTLRPQKQGRKGFDPGSVEIAWK